MKSTPKKKQPVKARKMWADCLLRPSYIQHVYNADTTEPVIVLPATQEAYDAMLKKGETALRAAPKPDHAVGVAEKWRDYLARKKREEQNVIAHILASIGITPPTK